MEIFVFGAKKAFKIAKNVVSKSYNMEIRSPAKSYNMKKKGLPAARIYLLIIFLVLVVRPFGLLYALLGDPEIRGGLGGGGSPPGVI